MAKHIKIDILGERKRVPITVLHRRVAAHAYNVVTDAFTFSHEQAEKWQHRSRPIAARVSERQQQVAELSHSLHQQRLHALSEQTKRLLELLRA